jgi:hypothetical protein
MTYRGASVNTVQLPKTDDEYKHSLEVALEELAHQGQKVSSIGKFFFFSSLINFACTIAVFAYPLIVAVFNLDSSGGFGLRDLLSLTSALMTTLVFALSGFYDTNRRKGEALYNELSNEMQIMIGVLDFRLALRRWDQAAGLPLVAGRHGLAIYLALNLLMTVTVLLFSAYFPLPKPS